LAFDHTPAIDLDVVATPFPEHDRLLEGVIPGVLLPVLDIIGELNARMSFGLSSS
jgi:hypothetical protein